MAVLLALLSAPGALAQIESALRIGRASGVRHRLHTAHAWSEMCLLARGQAPHLAIFDPYFAGPFDVGGCTAFHSRHPSVVLLPYGDFPPDSARDVLQLAALGVREVVLRGKDDSAVALYGTISGALLGGRLRTVLDELADLIPPRWCR